MTLLRTIYEMLRLQVTGLPFLFLALPALLAVYHVLPQKLRPALLLAASLGLYYTGGHNLVPMLGSVGVDYLLLQLMRLFDADDKKRQLTVIASAAKSVSLLLWFGVRAEVLLQPHILGLAVYTLGGTSCLLDTCRREIPYEKNPLRFGLYCCFFGKLYAGPLLPYEEFSRQLEDTRLSLRDLCGGFGWLIEGLFKMKILGEGLYTLYGSTLALPDTALAAWLTVIAFAFAFYYMLSGFSDIAQGLGLLFGLAMPKNFYYPYQSRSVEDFVDRFNISVSGFFRKAVRIKLPGRQQTDRLPELINLLVLCILFALWFGISLSHLLWGVYLALFIIMERYLYPGLLKNAPVFFCRVFTLCIVLAGFTILIGTSPADSLQLVQTMFNFSNFADNHVLYLLSTNWLLLVVSCFFATNLINLLSVKLRRAAPKVSVALFAVIDAVILIGYVALRL